jgi:NADH/NAD ratio-sensing transcriptional regulator Rex
VGTETEDGKEDRDISLSKKERLIQWARLLVKIYEVRAFTCPKCNSEMSIISIIMDPEEIRKILQIFQKIGRSPPGINTASLN